MKLLKEFVSRFGVSITLKENFITRRGNRYFLLNEKLKKLVEKDFFYAGVYLGKVKNGKFFPSFNLLSMIAEKKANKIFVDKRSEWLFICGRDIFKQGITKVVGSKRKGDYALILNQHGECLGFGKILCDLDEIAEGVAVKNISDIGDFLRREKPQI
ncbi:MAG: PUA domain-containing protein [Candidatus Bathyarchaeia archaeon]